MKQRRLNMPVVLVLALVWAVSAKAGVLVDQDWLNAHMNDPNVVIVDVQSSDNLYEKGHIPGALKVDRHADLEDYTQYPPNKYPQKEQFLKLMSRLGVDNNTVVVAYDDKYGLFASRMLVVMELYGHDPAKLKLLNGGITAWQAKGYLLTNEPGRFSKRKLYKTPGAKRDMLVTWCEVYKGAVVEPKPEVVLHDARPVDEFSGAKIRSVRGGHIPNSVNVTSVDASNHKKDHMFKAAEDIRKTFEEAGITPDKTIYTYCHSADRAAHTYIVLKHILNFKNVRIYDGSWSEWAALTALPAEDIKWAATQNTP